MDTFIINGNSVAPFFNNHDLIQIQTIKSINDIQLFDFIVYQEGYTGNLKKIIKQCVGLPGSFIRLEYPKIIINNQRYYELHNSVEKYLWESWIESCSGIIPSDSFFVLGTSPESIDSRQKGFIKFEQILGIPIKCPKI